MFILNIVLLWMYTPFIHPRRCLQPDQIILNIENNPLIGVIQQEFETLWVNV